MKCPACGSALHVHIHDSVTGRFDKAWCGKCRKFLRRSAAKSCPHCDLTFSEFERSGFFDCEFCYASFYDQLQRALPPLEVRQSPVFDKLAAARTADLRAILQDPSVTAAGIHPDAGEKESAGSLPDSRIEEPSLRVRIARNVSGVPYYHSLSPGAQSRLSEVLLSRRSIIGLWREEGRFSGRIYSGDEDHLRVEWLLPLSALDSDAAVRLRLEAIQAEIRWIDGAYEWQWHPDFGYLCACPMNAGLGLRISLPWDPSRPLPGAGESLEKAGKSDRMMVSARIRSADWQKIALDLVAGSGRLV